MKMVLPSVYSISETISSTLGAPQKEFGKLVIVQMRATKWFNVLKILSYNERLKKLNPFSSPQTNPSGDCPQTTGHKIRKTFVIAGSSAI